MIVALICRLGGDPDDPAHDDEMEARFWASAPGPGVTLVRRNFVFGYESRESAMRGAAQAGASFIFGGYPTTIAAKELDAALAPLGAVVVSPHYGNAIAEAFSPEYVLGNVLSVAAGTTGAGNLLTTYGQGLAVTIEPHDLAIGAQSWASASAAAILTRYPEAATNPRAALVRMRAGAQPIPGAARWTPREGFGVVKTFDHALVGDAIRTGETPTSNYSGYAGAAGTTTPVSGGYRYTYTSAHPFLVAYRGMPPPGAGNGARWMFSATNHHATQSVRLRSRNGGALVVLAPGESGTYTLDSFSPDSPFFIETPSGIGGEVDVTVTNLVQDVYQHVTTVPPLAPAGGALSPAIAATETAPGKVSVDIVRLGGVGTSLRVDGAEVLQTAGDSATLYLPAGVSTVEARALLAGGGVTEGHIPGTAPVAITQGYIPPAPTLDVQRVDETLFVIAEAEGATSLVVTAQAGAETPAPVVDGEIEWPAYRPARITAEAAGAGGTSDPAVALVPAVRSTTTLVAGGLHPVAVLA